MLREEFSAPLYENHMQRVNFSEIPYIWRLP